MRSYLEIALSAILPVPSEPIPDARTSTRRLSNQTHSFPSNVADKPEAQSNTLAQCGSSDCAGCYDVGDGRRIHPPKCGEKYRAWRERWEAGGKVQ
jgi:hypothetical protein